jgi:CheY-like chemotaxis protein
MRAACHTPLVHSEPDLCSALAIVFADASGRGERAMAKFLHILVVEDDDAVRDTLQMVLHELGYRVSSAENAAAARVTLAQHAIDLLITDEMMRGERGRQLAAYARSLGVPSLLMSADNETKRELAEGQQPFIGKPFLLEQLREAVVRVMA